MAGDAVELIVRFAGTLLSVTRLRRGGRYVIGKAPKVDLALDIATAFTLVDSVASGFRVRIPHGIRARSDGRECEGAFVLARGQKIDLVVGQVAIAIRHVSDVVAAVPRPALSMRIVPFAAIALIAHVAVVAAAVWTADAEAVTIPVVRAEPPKRVMPKQLPPVKPPKPKRERAKQAQQAAASQSAPVPQQVFDTPKAEQAAIAQAREAARGAAIFGGITAEDIARIRGTKDLAKELADVGPIYDEEAANAKGFGGAGGAFDPSKDPAFDSVKVGPPAIAISGRGMGANYRLPAHGKFREVGPPPVMGLTCDDAACKTVGDLDRLIVRDYVEKRYVDMLKCFERHGRSAQRIEVTLRFEIDGAGRATEVSAGGASGFGVCVAKLVERVKFPPAKPTQVTAYPIAFWRTSAG